jgi:hypothetical protein
LALFLLIHRLPGDRVTGSKESSMLRTMTRTGLLVLLGSLIAVPASAQIVQGLHFGGGWFIPRGLDSRVSGDTLVTNLTTPDTTQQLSFDISSFHSGQLFGEWLIEFGDHIEAGAGVGFYKGSAPSVYANFTHPGPDFSEIQQTLSLRIVPISGFVRFLPFGKPSTVQPYFGVGVSALNYRYVEDGEFIDSSQEVPAGSPIPTFPATYVATGTAVGPLAIIGIRVPIKGDIWAFTTEWRHQWGSGNTGGAAAGFLDDKIDLGGSNISFGFMMRF